MSNDEVMDYLSFIWVAFLFTGIGMSIGLVGSEKHWRNWAVEKGYMQYNPKTGELEEAQRPINNTIKKLFIDNDEEP